MNQVKEVFREKIKEQRAMLDPTEKKINCECIVEKYCELDSYRDAEIILAYISTNQEFDLSYLFERCKEDGKRVAVPRILSGAKKGARMEFVFLNLSEDYQDTLTRNIYHILEPMQGEIFEPEYYQDKKIDMILPGLCFDFYGGRIGYGAGYYDRYLANFPYPLHTTVLAFDFQLFDSLPCDEYDHQYDMLITENRYFIR